MRFVTNSLRSTLRFPDVPPNTSSDGRCKNANQRNDVELVFTARKYHAILVTRDGGSKSQPGGILGNRNRLLRDFQVQAVTPEEAVIRIRTLIARRDERLRRLAHRVGAPQPDWVGKD